VEIQLELVNKTYDHLGEVNDAFRGLGNQINKLNRLINNGGLSDETLEAVKSLRTQIQNRKDQIQNILNKAKNELGG